MATKDKMTPTETKRFNGLLHAKYKELLGSLCKRDKIIIENASDALDEVQLLGERELAIPNLGRDSGALRLIRRALYRIAHGPCGVYLHCEEDVLPKRMAAVSCAVWEEMPVCIQSKTANLQAES
jgi:hypothetical protein